MHSNGFSASPPPRTLLGELTAFPRPPSVVEGRGKGRDRRGRGHGKGVKGRRGEGRE